MFNPCHTMLLLQSICLSTDPSPSTNLLFNIMMRLLNGSLCALLFPDLEGLDIYGEHFMFYLEHWLTTVINPLVLILHHRYVLSFSQHIFSFSFFVIYQRIVLFSLSHLTTANLNYTLCHTPADPFYPVFKQYYYIFSEFYLSFMAFVVLIPFYQLCKLRSRNQKQSVE